MTIGLDKSCLFCCQGVKGKSGYLPAQPAILPPHRDAEKRNNFQGCDKLPGRDKLVMGRQAKPYPLMYHIKGAQLVSVITNNTCFSGFEIHPPGCRDADLYILCYQPFCRFVRFGLPSSSELSPFSGLAQTSDVTPSRLKASIRRHPARGL